MSNCSEEEGPKKRFSRHTQYHEVVVPGLRGKSDTLKTALLRAAVQ
jgi:hypothetical protein